MMSDAPAGAAAIDTAALRGRPVLTGNESVTRRGRSIPRRVQAAPTAISLITPWMQAEKSACWLPVAAHALPSPCEVA